MFEEYLEDAHFFTKMAHDLEGAKSKRYYRAAAFCTLAAMESFVNYIGDTFAQSNVLEPYEIAWLTDKRFGYKSGEFKVLGTEYHAVEDKMKFLLRKFVPEFDFATDSSWSRFGEFKGFRDAIVHPRNEEDMTSLNDYYKELSTGLVAIISLMNSICIGVFNKPLRKRLLDLYDLK